MKEIWMMFPCFTPSNVKLTSMSVIIPFVVPFTMTEAPATGPNSSSTVPVTFPFCWEMFTLGLMGVVSAFMLSGEHNMPANSIKPIGLKFFSIMCVFSLILICYR